MKGLLYGFTGVTLTRGRAELVGFHFCASMVRHFDHVAAERG